MESWHQTFYVLEEGVSYGKKLPGALYIFRPGRKDITPTLWQTLARAELAAQPDQAWNLLKLHTREFAITFLSYSNFDSDTHPALAESTKINLNTGSIVRTDYRGRANPPILHRKETFLPPEDPRIPVYADLTKREEKAGLYRDPSRIGLRVQWLSLLKRLGFAYEDHTLVPLRDAAFENDGSADVARHRTAIKRYDLSKPVKQLLDAVIEEDRYLFRLRMWAWDGR